jgi:hypothetical protein
MNWNEIYKKAIEKHDKAKEDAAFMMGSLMSSGTIYSAAFLYPEEAKNFFRSKRLLLYIEKRMKRNLQ